jgi:hypothetical protein
MSPGRCGVVARTLLAAYVLAAALLPLAHHDALCHLKSATHCATCVVGSSGETAAWSVGLDGIGLRDAGRAILLSASCHHSAPVSASSGRSPPAIG